MNDGNQRPNWILARDIKATPEPFCGLWWTLTTLLTAIAIGAALGVVLWLVLA